MTTPALNPFVLGLKESATLAINRRAQLLSSQGHEIFHFGFGQSPFPVPKLIQEALCRNAGEKSYLPTRGLPALLEAVAGFYRKTFEYEFTAENVCVGPGSKELIFQTIYLIEGPLLVPAPSWVSYGPQAALRGKEIVPIATKRENGYRLQLDELDKAAYSLGQKQKLLILNNPNNPTGAVYSQDEIEDLAEICRAYRIIVISDEIYAMIDYSKRPHMSLAHYYPEGTIVTGGLSKSFAAGGYRFGVMLVPDELEIVLNALQSVISETFSAVSSPIQYAALEAYGNFDAVKPYVMKMRDIFEFVSGYTYDRFISMGLNCPKPEGSFYLFPDFDNFREKIQDQGVLTGVHLCEQLLLEYGVATLPGSDFYLPARNFGCRMAPVDFDGRHVLSEWTSAQDMSVERTLDLFPRIVGGCDAIERYLRQLDD